jgi:anti-sigma regulatory factor (Ser/Thr protein kinase)
MLLEPTTASPALARAYCDDVLCGAVDAERRDDARLVVSELVTNAVKHARTRIELTIVLRAAVVRIEVTDFGVDRPQLWVGDEGGRGIPIVEALSRDWGVLDLGSAKTVWCELTV